jgi:hypothetical protein
MVVDANYYEAQAAGATSKFLSTSCTKRSSAQLGQNAVQRRSPAASRELKADACSGWRQGSHCVADAAA